MKWIWLGLVVTLGLLEFLDKRFAAIFYSISAFIAFIISLFYKNYLIEFLEFIFVGTLLLLIFRERIIKRNARKI